MSFGIHINGTKLRSCIEGLNLYFNCVNLLASSVISHYPSKHFVICISETLYNWQYFALL